MRVICMAMAGVVLASGLASTAEAAIQCQASKPQDARGYWQWRQIDGRRCWYQGRQKVSKSELFWSKGAAQPQQTRPQEGRTEPPKTQPPKVQQAKPQPAKPQQTNPQQIKPPSKTQQAKADEGKPNHDTGNQGKAEPDKPSKPRQDKQQKDEVERLLHSYWPPLR